MANTWQKFLLLFLAILVVEHRADPCPTKCSCTKRKKVRVDCRGQGLTQAFSSEMYPSDMEVLDLSKNNISVIRKGFLGLHSQLEKLYLHRNSIRIIEGRAFVGLSKLNRLVLKQNKITRLEANTFIGLPNLDSLDLSVNKIRSIDGAAFSGFQKLTKLILSNNNFTSIENTTFTPLKSLIRINLRNVPLTCNCRLNPFIQYLKETTSLKKISGTCRKIKIKLSSLKGTNLCETPPDLIMTPPKDQVVAVGDFWRLRCSVTTKRRLNLEWKRNGKSFKGSKNVDVENKRFSKQGLSSDIVFRSVSQHDAGEYACYGKSVGVEPKKITISVLSAASTMCARDMIHSDRGRFVWPVTFAGKTAAVLCPSLGNSVDDKTKIRRTCSQDGVWGEVNFGNCRWRSLSEKLGVLAKLLQQPDFKDVAAVTSQMKKLSQPSHYQNNLDVSRTLGVVAGIFRKQGNEHFKEKVLDDILATYNNLMDVNSSVLYDAQRIDQSPSRLGAHLELISRTTVSQNISRALPNIVIGSVDLNPGFQGKTCYVIFKSKKPSQAEGVQCTTRHRKEFAVSVHIPKIIFETQAAATGKDGRRLRVQFLVYRNAKLFPNVVSNITEKSTRDRNVSSSVFAIQMAKDKELNLTKPLIIRFATEVGTNPLISHFDFGDKVGGMSWSPNHDCHVYNSTVTMTTVGCARLVNKNLAIMSLRSNNVTVVYPMEVVVYLGAVIAGLLLLATLITFAGFRNLRFNRDDVLILMNACLSLLVIVTTFAFGIDRTSSDVACLVVGIFLHFFFLASLLWLGSYVVCVSRRLKPPKESEETFNPVLRYYMVSWGVPAVICGITLAGDVKNYTTSQYCWLKASAGLGAFVGPACLLFLVNCVLLVRLHLLLAHGGLERRPAEEDSEEERLQRDEPEVIEPIPDPDGRLAAEKSAVTLYLVATWVVMSLIYVNFIIAYFLIKSRSAKLSWKLLSYTYALANVALGASVFGFHCVARVEVRKTWKQACDRAHAMKAGWGRWRTEWISGVSSRKKKRRPENGVILVNGEEVNPTAPKNDSDRQSNITLPSSAALTNDVFFNGRPLSTGRVSLLDDVDFPSEEKPQGCTEVNEVDITERGNSEDGRRRSQGSMHSDRKSVSKPPSEVLPLPEEQMTVPGNSYPSDVHDEHHVDITDAVTSKSDSSAPTAIEIPVPKTSTTLNDSIVDYPQSKSAVTRESLATPSSPSINETPPVRLPTFKRKRSSDSLNSRNGSLGPKARKLPQLQNHAYPSSSSTFSEVQPKDPPDPKGQRPSDAMNSRGIARNAVPSTGTQRTRNRYKDGREKPEPKQWTGGMGGKIAYVPVPHVSKIHREPSRNETSV